MTTGGPVTEQVLLDVIPGQEADFEVAFGAARHVVAESAGFRSVRLSRCVEQPNRYLLLIEWASLEAHTEGFRGGPLYPRSRRELLHHFYDPFPTVLHFETVTEVPA